MSPNNTITKIEVMSIKNINNRSIIIASGNTTKLESEIINILEKIYKIEFCTHLSDINHPDIILVTNSEEKDSIGIEEINRAKTKLSLKPYLAETITLIVCPSEKITVEAQNSFLKILEEPPRHALIILATHNSDNLLDTVKSRCIIYNFEKGGDEKSDFDINSLFKLDIVDRFKLIEKINTDKNKKKKFQKLLLELERYYHKELFNIENGSDDLSRINVTIKKIQEARIMIQKNVNPRVVMENLMLNI